MPGRKRRREIDPLIAVKRDLISWASSSIYYRYSFDKRSTNLPPPRQAIDASRISPETDGTRDGWSRNQKARITTAALKLHRVEIDLRETPFLEDEGHAIPDAGIKGNGRATDGRDWYFS